MKSNVSPSKSSVLQQKYNLQPTHESVVRLGQLITQRTSDNMDQIAAVVANDPVLKCRLLRAAKPKRGEPIEDVEEAIFRCGVEAVIVLAMADPLLRAVTSTFESLLGVQLEAVDETSVGSMNVAGHLAKVGFSGHANGEVFLRMRRGLGEKIATTLLATAPGEVSEVEIMDAIGEIGNTIVGNFKSNLCDAGLSCKLTVPEVTQSNEFTPPETAPGRHQCYAFLYESSPLLINIAVESTD